MPVAKPAITAIDPVDAEPKLIEQLELFELAEFTKLLELPIQFPIQLAVELSGVAGLPGPAAAGRLTVRSSDEPVAGPAVRR